ncbi:MAG: XdhC family protein [Candidatus Dormibacteria bacterium]
MSGGDLLGRAAELRRARVPFVRAKVVLAERPTSAKPGDEALVLADGSIEGFVGGNCVESTLRAQGLLALHESRPILLRVSPVEEAAQPGRVTVVNPCLSGGTLEIFLEPVVPAPLVAVVGHSPTARALGEVGRSLGYQMAEWDEARASSFDALVVASHGTDEEPALTAALRAGVAYVALVASSRRGAAVVASLDLDPELTRLVHTPAGLDIGARGPEEVALSILAEIIACRTQGRVVKEAPPVPMAVDPICGMQVAAVDGSLHVDHLGVRQYFCGPGCQLAFAQAQASSPPG